MTQMADFSTVVELYRLSSRPSFDGRCFSAIIPLDDNIINLIRSITNARGAFGRFEDIEINGETIDEDDLATHSCSSGDKISFDFKTPKNGAERFYTTTEDFLSTNSLKKGIIPDDYYIVEYDFHSKENAKPPLIIKLEKLCSIISSLADIAHFHDTKSELTNYRLVFVKNSDATSSSIVLETCVLLSMLGVENLDNSVIVSLIDKSSSNIPHKAEKTGIFRNTLVEFVNENKYNFEQLILNWNGFLKLFESNLSTYMSGFSFHKARKEVATAEAEFAEKISKLVTDLTSKVLAIPITLLASISILKLTSKYEISLVLLGIIITSWILHLVLINQEKQLQHIWHAKEVAFKPFLSDKKTYPQELNNEINEALKELSFSQAKCQSTIRIFMYLAWLPSSIAAGISLSIFFI